MGRADKHQDGDQAELSEEERRVKQRAAAIDQLIGHLAVSVKGKSRVISVVFTSGNPKTAALVVNTLAELYIREQRQRKFRATQQAAAWLNEHVATIRGKVEASERAVEEFRRKSGLLGGAQDVISNQIAKVSNDLIGATTVRAEAESRLHRAKQLIESGDVDSLADMVRSPIIHQLRQQQVDIGLKMDELSKRYSLQHPDMDDLEAQAADLQAAIDRELKKTIKQFENQVSSARAREASLRDSAEYLTQRSAKANVAGVELRALETDAAANRELLGAFLSRYKETSAQEDIDLHYANASIISKADIPSSPESGKNKVIVAIALLGSTFIGSVLTLLIDRWQTGFPSMMDIEETTETPVLGLIPMLSWSTRIRRVPPTSYILENPQSAFAKSIHNLYTSLLLSQSDKPTKTVLLVSAQRGEGKTTTAVCLAQTQALLGKKVVVVDTDIRQPDIHRTFAMPRQPGLVEHLAGNAPVNTVARVDEASGAHVIPAGSSFPIPPDLLGSDLMGTFLDGLAKRYDLIILDSPPLMYVSDASIVSTKVDATVFVMRCAYTKPELASVALKKIAKRGGRVAGLVLSMVNIKRIAKYSYGDLGFVSGPAKRDYAA